MRISEIRAGETYRGRGRNFLWKVLSIAGSRVVVQRKDRPHITFELPANEFAELVETI